jgi:hypothetical protein
MYEVSDAASIVMYHLLDSLYPISMATYTDQPFDTPTQKIRTETSVSLNKLKALLSKSSYAVMLNIEKVRSRHAKLQIRETFTFEVLVRWSQNERANLNEI